MDYFIGLLGKLFPFLKITIFIAFSSMLLGLILGCILAAMKMSRSTIQRKIAEGYTTVIRCTPVIILLFLSYYGLPILVELLTGVDISRGSKVIFAIAALTMFSSAIISEIVRPAYLAVPRGQYEAAVMNGLKGWQANWYVIFPQAFYIALPNLGNMMMSLIQQSALAFLIGVVDVMGQAKIINGMTYGLHIVKIYLAVSLLYWLLSVIVGLGIDNISLRLQKKLR